MIWLVWRRQRVALLVALTVILLVAVVLVVGRIRYAVVAGELGVGQCLEPGAARCDGPAWAQFSERVAVVLPLALLLPVVLPGVLGIIVGAGLFGRDLEQGTHVFALTQSVGRLRWWATGLLGIGLPAAALLAALTPALEWVRQPVLAVFARSPLESPVFETTGVLLAGYTVLGFTLASVAGLLFRNVLAAVVVAAAVQITLQLVLGFGARDRYLAPERAVAPASEAESAGGFLAVPEGALTLNLGYLDAAGRDVSARDIGGDGSCGGVSYAACLQAAGVARTYLEYQPASRYWPFQGIESGILLALVAGTLGAGVWGLRKQVG